MNVTSVVFLKWMITTKRIENEWCPEKKLKLNRMGSLGFPRDPIRVVTGQVTQLGLPLDVESEVGS